jgi:hypothetical protein
LRPVAWLGEDCVGAVVAVATHWPFMQSDVTEALEQDFGSR